MKLEMSWDKGDRNKFLHKCRRFMRKFMKKYSSEIMDSLAGMESKEKMIIMDSLDLISDGFKYAESVQEQMDSIQESQAEILKLLKERR